MRRPAVATGCRAVPRKLVAGAAALLIVVLGGCGDPTTATRTSSRTSRRRVRGPGVQWYDFRTNPRGRVRVLETVDESTYQGGGMGKDHPVTWAHGQGRGRAWYTALGHTEASWSEQRFLAHLLGGIRWAAGIG